MSNPLINLYENSPKVAQLVAGIHPQARIQLSGLAGSSFSLVLQALFKKTTVPFLLVVNDKEEAAYYLNDLEQFLGADDVLFYPGSYRRPYQIEDTDNANVLLRAEVLNRIHSHRLCRCIWRFCAANECSHTQYHCRRKPT